jgi:hypothetical protein
MVNAGGVEIGLVTLGAVAIGLVAVGAVVLGLAAMGAVTVVLVAVMPRPPAGMTAGALWGRGRHPGGGCRRPHPRSLVIILA